MFKQFFNVSKTEQRLLVAFVLFESSLIAIFLFLFENLAIDEAIFAFILNATLHYFLSLPIFRLSKYYYQFLQRRALVFLLIIFSSLIYSLLLQGLFVLPFLLKSNTDALNQVSQEMHWQIFGHIVRYLLITGISFMMIYVEKFEQERVTAEKLRSEVKYAELEALKYQLNPHFLFNSLNSIHSLISISKEKSREMLLLLSSYLRYTLTLQGKSVVSINEEIEHIKRYFQIEKIRFGSRLNFKLVNNLSNHINIPVLLVQPIIENMIKHGLAKTEDEFEAFIHFSEENHFVKIYLENSCPKKQNDIHEGVGFKNIRKRLKIHFEEYSFDYKIEKNVFKCTIKYPMNQV
jgi:sensor histidine kinase YesM